MPVAARDTLKVLHIAHGAHGGIGRVETLLSAVWASNDGLEVTTLFKNRLPLVTKNPRAPLRGRIGPRGQFHWRFAMLRACARTDADVVLLNHLIFTPFAAIIHALHPSSRVVVWVYGAEAWRRPDPLRRFGLRFVDQVWSISEYTARRFSAVASFRRDRIAVVPLALTPERTESLMRRPAPEGRSADHPEVLTVSRLWKHEAKGIDALIEALALCRPAVHLTIVGEGEDRLRLEQVAQEKGVASRVTFTGHVDDALLVELYRRCTLFALPSAREGFGLVFLEAMAAGKPVVAARAAAVPELVRDRETGLLVPLDDPHAMAQAISELIDEPANAAKMGERGRARVRRDYTFHRFAGQVAGLLADLRRIEPLAISRAG